MVLVVDHNVHHAARLPPPPAPARRQRQARAGRPPQRRRRRRPRPAGPGRHGRASAPTASCSPTWSARAPASSSPRGGRGGLGNAGLASAGARRPGFALLGEPGETRDVVLELKTVADVALVGFPSAGKSSLIAALSAARPKIADYPFTTLVPNLGRRHGGRDGLHVADVPGLIPGASEGQGLGLEFLRHVERCAALVHVIDCATLEPDRDPLSDLDAIEAEIEAYGGLDDRPAAGRAQQDRPAGRARPGRPGQARARGPRAHRLRGARGHPGGPAQLTYAMAGIVVAPTGPPPGAGRDPDRAAAHRRGRRRVHGRARPETGGFVVRGAKPERWIVQTHFDNDEAVGYLADRLARLGVEAALAEAGACRATR